MTLPEIPLYLLDVGVAIALLDEQHSNYTFAATWFKSPGRQWALCCFTEAGILRFFSRPATGDLSLAEAMGLLDSFRTLPGYHYQSINSTWPELVRPFAKRLHGHRQITDAYLLGLAIREDLVLVTFDQAMLHLAGEHRQHVHLLDPSAERERTN